MRRLMSQLLVNVGLASVIVGCSGDDQVGVPQPQPVPDIERIRASNPTQSSTLVLFIGLPGAVAGEGNIRARNRDSDAEVVALTTSDGGFALRIDLPTLNLARVELRFERAGRISDPVTIDVANTYGPQLGPLARGGLVSSVGADGRATVSNQGGSAPTATPDVDVLIANLNSGQSVVTTTDARGAFSAQIQAEAGDRIGVMLVDPTSPRATSHFIEGLVPP